MRLPVLLWLSGSGDKSFSLPSLAEEVCNAAGEMGPTEGLRLF